MKTKVICVMGKSGSGKSTLINETVNLFNDFYAVKSYTTRKQRENDPEDIKTHKFVLKECLDRDEENKQVVSLYHSDKGYYSWTTHSCFKEDKINLYAIDPKACLEFIEKYSNIYDIYPIYIFVNDEERFERLRKRDNVTELPEEKHLSLKILEPLLKTDMKYGLVLDYNSLKINLQDFISEITNMIIERGIN